MKNCIFIYLIHLVVHPAYHLVKIDVYYVVIRNMAKCREALPTKEYLLILGIERPSHLYHSTMRTGEAAKHCVAILVRP